MPKIYEAIRDAFLAKGKSPKEAKESAARIYISQSKSKKGRSTRAKSLQD